MHPMKHTLNYLAQCRWSQFKIPNAGHQAIPLQAIPLQLLGGGDHFDDITRSNQRRLARGGINSANAMLPRQRMLNEISTLGVSRPTSNLT